MFVGGVCFLGGVAEKSRVLGGRGWLGGYPALEIHVVFNSAVQLFWIIQN